MSIKLRPYQAINVCTEDELKTMILGVVHEIEKEDSNWSVYVGGDTLIFASKTDEGKIEIYDCKIRRTNLGDDDITTLTEPIIPVNKGFPS